MTQPGRIAIEHVLDVCTPEGKTWLARLTGLDTKFGFKRDFLNTIARDTSRSGMTGTFTYLLTEEGVYQAHEGRRRLGDTWLKVTGDKVEKITREDAIEYLKANS